MSLCILNSWTSNKPSQSLTGRSYSTVRETRHNLLLMFGTNVWQFLPGCSKSVRPVRSNRECSWGRTKSQALWRSGRLLQYRPLPTNSAEENCILEVQIIYKVSRPTHSLVIQNYLKSDPINSFIRYRLKKYIYFICFQHRTMCLIFSSTAHWIQCNISCWI